MTIVGPTTPKEAKATNWPHVFGIIAMACENIRKGRGTEADWQYLHEHADKVLVQAMIREVCCKKLDIDPYPQLRR